MLVIILSIIGALIFTYLGSRYFSRNKQNPEGTVIPAEVDADCCGAHEVCDKETLLSFDDEIEYFQDEELDDFRGIPANSYSNEQIEIFREVLYTMHDDEVAGWLRSLQLRNVNVPIAVREEALMIVADVRDLIRKPR